MIDVAGHDAQQKIDLAHQHEALGYLGRIANRLLELAQRLRLFAQEANLHENLEIEAEHPSLEQRNLGADKTGFLQSLYPSPAGRLREPDRLGDFGHRDRGVALQDGQNFDIRLVEIFLHLFSKINWYQTINYPFRAPRTNILPQPP